ncbi:MAG: hypothetical protein ACYDHE_02450 [Candidatus Acidiferrales bacterium]
MPLVTVVSTATPEHEPVDVRVGGEGQIYTVVFGGRVTVAGSAMVLLAQPHLTTETIASVRGLIDELCSPSTGGGSRFGSVIGTPGLSFGLDRL